MYELITHLYTTKVLRDSTDIGDRVRNIGKHKLLKIYLFGSLDRYEIRVKH